MKLGIDVFLEKHVSNYKGQSIGLVTNHTGLNGQLIPTLDLLHEHPDIHLVALYGPEHGIRGTAREGEKVANSTDPYTGLPVFSLYGSTRKPTKAMLADVDVIVIDLQDIGSRYYTYIYTMAYVMEACGELGKKVVVLDRPNPIGGTTIEGNLLESNISSFVGLYPIPNRHSLTMGELAQLFVHEFGINCDVTVIPMEGWKRDMYYDETGLLWVPPSPNTTCLDMCILYSGTCLIEGTNLSEGRGTTHPFEVIGAPYIDGYQLSKSFNSLGIAGVIARPTSFTPTYQKHLGVYCEGIQLHVTNRNTLNSLEAGLLLIETIAQLYPQQFSFLDGGDEGNHSFFDLLSGSKALQSIILEGKTREFLQSCKLEVEQFRKQAVPYLLYE